MARQTTVKPRKMHVRKGDTVMVIAGKDAGKKGKVLNVDPKAGRVFVEKLNMVSRHTKPTQGAPQGGIIKKEASIDGSNVMVFCNKCSRPVRISREAVVSGGKTRHIRKCCKCGEKFDK